jgi:1-acyl-sn-glycerol-3-phosphate acyltransferase
MSSARENLLNLIRKLIDKCVNLKIYNPEYPENAGGALVVTNHISRLDTAFLMVSTKRRDIIGMVASNYRKAPILGSIVSKLGAIWVNRGEGDFSALRKVKEYIQKGWIVGLAPEGKRSRSKQLIEAKQGVALMAMKTGAPIIPVGLTGTADMLKAFSKFKKMDVSINFGEPFHLPERLEDEHNRDYVGRAVDEIMCRIAILLPENKRGFYAKHPRIQSLLAETDQSKNPVFNKELI